MKMLPHLLCLFSCLGSFSMIHGASNPASTLESGAESEVISPTPYGLDRYQKLLNKSPFDFDVPPQAAPPPVDAMEGWALVGISKTADYQAVTILNMKGNERIRLTHFNNPAIKKANEVRVGSDVYTLEGIEFEEGEPQLLKNATARITKGGNEATVAYHAEAIQKAAGAGGQPRAGGAPGMPTPVLMPNNPQNQGGNNNLLQMLQSRNATGGGGVAPNPQQPMNNGQPNQVVPQQLNLQAATNNQANLIPPNVNAQLTNQMNAQPQVFNNNAPAPTTAAPAPNGATQPGQQPRRRVVLPNTDGLPPVPGQ